MKTKVWRETVIVELKSIEKNYTWEMVQLLDRNKTIDVKWTFKVKVNPDGTISRYKERLVFRGFLKNYGINYSELFLLW